jgi:hypothetical protein
MTWRAGRVHLYHEKFVSDVSEAVSDTTNLMMEKKAVSATSNASNKLTTIHINHRPSTTTSQGTKEEVKK